jgi:ornithine carbamoyltransferase
MKIPENLKGRDFTTVTDFSRDEIETVLSVASDLKSDFQRGHFPELLKNRTLFMIFCNCSAR